MQSKRNEYYKAREAQEKLGVSKAKFYKWVREKLIPQVILPGMKQGVYPKRDIDALVLSMSASASRLIFSKSSPADHLSEIELDRKAFRHNFTIPLADRIAFQLKNEFTFYSLKVFDEIVGYTAMFRFTDPVLTALLEGQKSERDIKLKDVVPFDQLEPFSIYINLVVVSPDLSLHARRFYAGTLILHFIYLLTELMANTYQITMVYIVSTTKESQRIAEHLGFQRLSINSLNSGRLVYKYPLDRLHIQELYKLRNRYSRRLCF